MLVFSLVLLGILLRVLTCSFGYSGEGNPPMFGDYEAQRHWMEITINLPANEWYNHTKDNDLMYWGLDYPPLTAYHSWICGWFARLINDDFVTLHTSRGYESSEHKIFMRSTVLISDLLIYMLGAVLFHRLNQIKPGVSLDIGVFILFVYPGFILIDHGHFQYNCVALGLVLLAYVAWHKERFVLGCIAFCLALNFKQMSLYYALPVFFYLLGICKKRLNNQGVVASVALLVKLSLTVISTFVVCWLPFLTDLKTVSQVFRRIFPFERGIFEDKVANFWIIINTVYKIREHFSNNTLALYCATVTLLCSLPSCMHLFFNPTRKELRYALLNSSLAFFLFSYHVHEKTILFVSLPVVMCFKYDPLPCFWFLVLSTFSMFPLLLKDGLLVPYIACSGLFCVSVFTYHQSKVIDLFANKYSRHLVKYLFASSMLGVVTISTSFLVFRPPVKYPDLYPVVIALFSATHFLFFFIYFNLKQLVHGSSFKLKIN